MRRRLRVVIGQQCFHVGDLVLERDDLKQISAFRYSEEWLESDFGFALSPRFELNANWIQFSGIERDALPGFVADGTPDEWGRKILYTALGENIDETHALLSVNDTVRSGALRYIDENGEIVSQFKNSVPRLGELSVLRALCVALESHRGDRKGIAEKLRGTCDSLGGSRPKACYQGDKGLTIAKFSLAKDNLPIERMEVAALKLAKAVSLRASSATLALLDSPHPVAIIRRFDRVGSRRVHYVSADTFMQPQSRKSNIRYVDIADAMRSTCGNGEQTLTELSELFRRIIFYVLVTNTDDHLRNLGFLYVQRGRWQLAPMFDINPSPGRKRTFKTSIRDPNNKTLMIEEAIDAAEHFELSKDAATAAVKSLAQKIQDSWRKLALESGMSHAQCQSYHSAFNHPEMESALKLNDNRLT